MDIKATMTVKEMIRTLNQYPKDMPVIATWETVHTEFKLNNFSIIEGYQGSNLSVLVIDVDQYN